MTLSGKSWTNRWNFPQLNWFTFTPCGYYFNVKIDRTKVGSYGNSINYACRCFNVVGSDLTRNRAKLHV